MIFYIFFILERSMCIVCLRVWRVVCMPVCAHVIRNHQNVRIYVAISSTDVGYNTIYTICIHVSNFAVSQRKLKNSRGMCQNSGEGKNTDKNGTDIYL